MPAVLNESGLVFFPGCHALTYKGVTTAWSFAKVIFCVGMYGKISKEDLYCLGDYLTWDWDIPLLPCFRLQTFGHLWSRTVLIHTYSVFFPDVIRLKQGPRKGTCNSTNLTVGAFCQKAAMANFINMMEKFGRGGYWWWLPVILTWAS